MAIQATPSCSPASSTRDDAGVLQPPRRLGLAQEAVARLGEVLGLELAAERERLQRHLAPAFRVAAEVERAHRAALELALDAVAADVPRRRRRLGQRRAGRLGLRRAALVPAAARDEEGDAEHEQHAEPDEGPDVNRGERGGHVGGRQEKRRATVAQGLRRARRRRARSVRTAGIEVPCRGPFDTSARTELSRLNPNECGLD